MRGIMATCRCLISAGCAAKFHGEVGANICKQQERNVSELGNLDTAWSPDHRHLLKIVLGEG